MIEGNDRIFKFLIYGTGTFAERYIDSTEEIISDYPMEIIGFVDSDIHKTEFHGYKVYHPSDISNIDYDKIYIFAYEKKYIEIYQILVCELKNDRRLIGNISDLLYVAQRFRRNTLSSVQQNRKPQIYDCFLFFNEEEILDIRLSTLDEFVDKFVIVELPCDHRGNPKDYNFDKIKDKFRRFEEKIIYIKADDVPEYVDCKGFNWTMIEFQRRCISRGLTDCQPEDVIIISDCDEIPRPELMAQIKNGMNQAYVPIIEKMLDEYSIALKQDYYYFFFNCHCVTRRNTTTLTKFKNLINPHLIRDLMDCMPYIDFGGWHLTYFGGLDRIKEKISSSVEGVEQSDTDIEYRIKNGKDIYGRIGDEFELEFLPKESLDFPNIDKWIKKYPQFFKEME